MKIQTCVIKNAETKGSTHTAASENTRTANKQIDNEQSAGERLANAQTRGTELRGQKDDESMCTGWPVEGTIYTRAAE